MTRYRLWIWGAGAVFMPVLSWLALPGTFSWWPLLGLCLAPLLYAVAASPSRRSAFLLGLVAGVVFYALQIYWIVPVLVHYGGVPWFLAIPALFLLLCYMGLYLGVFCIGFHVLADAVKPLHCCFAAAAWWVGLDWLRGWLFSGFPWLDFGYGLWALPGVTQAADLFGHFGYTFIVVLVNGAVWFVVTQRATLSRICGVLGPVFAVCLLTVGYAAIRWSQVDRMITGAESTAIGIIQGNVEQDQKWSPTVRQQTVGKYLQLSGVLAGQSPELIVWPETALPFYPQNSELFPAVLTYIGLQRQPLLTGAPWYEVREDGVNRFVSYYNAALLLLPNGQDGRYYKSHLVPFGEYVPLQRYLPFIAPLVEAVGQFSRGQIGQPLSTGRIAAGVLICFESIFPDLARAWVDHGANVLVNITNDAWYGRSSAPYQSWSMTVFRAIENRRSLIRAANTGISGAVDPLGRIICQSGLFVDWSAVVTVPLLEGRSWFVRGGFLFAPLCGVAALLILAGAVKRSQRTV